MKIKAYCMRCKAMNNMKNEGRRRNLKMNQMVQGLCTKCDGNVATILKKKKNN